MINKNRLETLILLVGIVVLAAGTVNAQTGPHAISISPLGIARLINQRSKTTTAASMAREAIWQELGIPPGEFANCSGCEARVFYHELDNKPGPEVIVKVTGPPEQCRYLVFTNQRQAWQFLGVVDLDFNKYEMSRHRVEHADKNAWLVIRAQEGSGSGFALYGETWYEVSAGGIKPVLSYPSDGHTNPGSLGVSREFKVKPIGLDSKTVALPYTVTYTASMFDERASLRRFINTHRLYYKWDQAASEFVFDTNKSEVSPGEIAAIANIQSEEEDEAAAKIGGTSFYAKAKSFAGHGYEVFLKNNVAALMRIANGRNAGAKDWLRHFLDECDDTPEKQTLAAALSMKSGGVR